MANLTIQSIVQNLKCIPNEEEISTFGLNDFGIFKYFAIFQNASGHIYGRSIAQDDYDNLKAIEEANEETEN